MSVTPEYSSFSLLTPEEREILAATLGPKCKALSTAVLQVYYTTPPDYSEWIYGFCGVATFTKDSSRRSYFIQIYDIENRERLFEQEIYDNFVYQVDDDRFQQFESEEAVVGLHFAHSEEAKGFRESVEGYLRRRVRQQEAQRAQQQENEVPTNVPKIPKVKLQDRRGKEKVPKLITKNDIGLPQDFRHIQHVGMGPPVGGESTPGTVDSDALLSCIIQMMNENTPMNQNSLEDPQMKEMIMNHIEEKGGIWKVYKRLKRNKSKVKTSTPSSPLPDSQSRTPTVKVIKPTPDLPLPQQNSLQPPQPPPLPPSSPRVISPPRSPSPSQPSPHAPQLSVHRPPSPLTSPQAAPPLPPLSHPANRAPKPPPLKGRTVQKVPQGKGPPPPPQTQATSPPPPPPAKPVSGAECIVSSRSALLDQIRDPKIKLKNVASMEESSPRVSPTPESSNVILNSLARALEHRGRACRGDSEDTSDESTTDDEYDEDEWD